MIKTLLASAVVAACLFASAGSAEATKMLAIRYAFNGDSFTTVNDDMAGDLDGSAGSMFVKMTTSLTDVGARADNILDVSSLHLSVLGATASPFSRLQIEISGTDFTPPVLGGMYYVLGNLSVTVPLMGSMSYEAWINPANGLFAEEFPILTDSTNTAHSSSNTILATLSSFYSLTERFDLHPTTGVGSLNIAGSTQVTAVPEPTTLGLLGMGLLALMWLLRWNRMAA